jgi:predicted heme/steroid binding protein
MSFRRWKIWDSFGKFLLPVVCVLLIVGFGYIEFFYAENIKSEVSDEEDTNIVSEESNESVSDDTDSELKVFTLEELAMYDGQDGSPAYTAVDGVVYDMSDVFEDGEHYSHYAGKELTSAFYSYHTLDEITKYPVVGEME